MLLTKKIHLLCFNNMYLKLENYFSKKHLYSYEVEVKFKCSICKHYYKIQFIDIII